MLMNSNKVHNTDLAPKVSILWVKPKKVRYVVVVIGLLNRVHCLNCETVSCSVFTF